MDFFNDETSLWEFIFSGYSQPFIEGKYQHSLPQFMMGHNLDFQGRQVHNERRKLSVDVPIKRELNNPVAHI